MLANIFAHKTDWKTIVLLQVASPCKRIHINASKLAST